MNTTSSANISKIRQYLGELGPKTLPLPPQKKKTKRRKEGIFINAELVGKTLKAYNLPTTEAVLIKLANIMYLHEVHHLPHNWNVTHKV